MESFQSTDVLLGLFALIVAAVILILYSWLRKPRSSLSGEASHQEKEFKVICELVAGRLPAEWTFVETFTDEIFFHQSEEVRQAFKSLCGESASLPFVQLIVIEKLLAVFEKQGIIEKASLMYSREALLKYPDIFNSLPEWRKADCENTLLVTSGKHRGETLVQFRKIPNGQESSYKAMKDIGMEAVAPYRNLE